ncbi:MAG TPA: protein kinase [Acidobacteriaceae bacterium]|jgi:Tol biopolymer transport system component/predicted Ser/Thr protein kinase|nr:protein kinase [Acidobacteriaceae bacterium]
MRNREAEAEHLFGEAQELGLEERRAFLDRVCRGDAALREQVEALLAEHERLQGFLSESPLKPAGEAGGSETLPRGTRLGRYTIVELLGSGGMGVVYRAVDASLGRDVAVKVLRGEAAEGDELVARFRREGRALASLNHPNICTIYEAGEENGRVFIAMEFLEGMNLGERIGQKPLAAETAVELGIEIADALDAAHKAGIVHRDIKPANIFVTARGHAKVLDFGLAKVVVRAGADGASQPTVSDRELTNPGSGMGTVGYMSPEQVRGEEADARSDLFSFGIVLYLMTTGALPFRGESMGLIFEAILNRTPVSPVRLNPKVPAELERVIAKALEKDRELRYQHAAEMRTDLRRLARRSDSHFEAAAAPAARRRLRPGWILAALVLLAAVGGWQLLVRGHVPPRLADSSQWQQLTFFTDAVVYPALSSDGRMLTFIRGSDPFLVRGDVYVQMLPGGEPVQLTHDGRTKLSPSFTPDNSQVVYSIADPWDTWEVPVLGGAPHLFMPNSSSLTFIDGGKRVLFSEIKQGQGLHMGVVSSDQSRGNLRELYLPAGNRSMVHHSWPSPDGSRLLVVEMDNEGHMLPCRVVGMGTSAPVEAVGPPAGLCLGGGWSVDGRYVYVTAQTDDYHIWRQRVPDGKAEQLTFGPTSQVGLAMAPDGKSLVTAVGTQDRTVWVHDRTGDHAMSTEGETFQSLFSHDGRKLYFLKTQGQEETPQLWVRDLDTGSMDPVAPGFPVSEYAVSQDGKLVALVRRNSRGRSGIWIAPTSRRRAPVELAATTDEDQPSFLPDGDVVFRVSENGANYAYRMKPDGSGRHKIIGQRILDIVAVSPTGQWILAAVPQADEEFTNATVAFAADGSSSRRMCVDYCVMSWNVTGSAIYLYDLTMLSQDVLMLPVKEAGGLPEVPAGGIGSREQVLRLKSGPPLQRVDSAFDQDLYAWTKLTTRRNLYRIPLR